MGITTDNASNNLSFIKSLEEWGNLQAIPFSAEENHFRCLAHCINIGVQKALNILANKLQKVNFL